MVPAAALAHWAPKWETATAVLASVGSRLERPPAPGAPKTQRPAKWARHEPDPPAQVASFVATTLPPVKSVQPACVSSVGSMFQSPIPIQRPSNPKQQAARVETRGLRAWFEITETSVVPPLSKAWTCLASMRLRGYSRACCTPAGATEAASSMVASKPPGTSELMCTGPARATPPRLAASYGGHASGSLGEPKGRCVGSCRA